MKIGIGINLVRGIGSSDMILSWNNLAQRIGSRFFLVNTELRVPLIDYFVTRFPLPIGVAGVRGAGFMDVGSAWNTDRFFRGTRKNAEGKTSLDDIVAGFGWGLRVNLGIMLFRAVQNHKPAGGGKKPRFGRLYCGDPLLEPAVHPDERGLFRRC